jgi:hypothetical protein
MPTTLERVRAQSQGVLPHAPVLATDVLAAAAMHELL